jgi:hypothetical protein
VKKTIYIIFIVIFILNCTKISNKVIYTNSISDITIKNNEEYYAILNMSIGDADCLTYFFSNSPISVDERNGYFLAKTNYKTGKNEIISTLPRLGVKCIYKKGKLLVVEPEDFSYIIDEANNFKMENRLVFVRSFSTIFDFIVPDYKVISDDNGFYEYDLINNAITYLKSPSFHIKDAKYNPVDNTVIAYIGASNTADNMAGDIYLIKNDGSGNTLVVSGYNAEQLYWEPEGNEILFINLNAIYKINKDGMGLIKIREHNLELDKYYLKKLYYNCFIYIGKENKMNYITF